MPDKINAEFPLLPAALPGNAARWRTNGHAARSEIFTKNIILCTVMILDFF
jgi:hypothetical protein